MDKTDDGYYDDYPQRSCRRILPDSQSRCRNVIAALLAMLVLDAAWIVYQIITEPEPASLSDNP